MPYSTIGIQMPNRYCYIVRSAEKDVVGVFTGREESEDEGVKWAHRQGAKLSKAVEINKELTSIVTSGGPPCEVWIERHRLK